MRYTVCPGKCLLLLLELTLKSKARVCRLARHKPRPACKHVLLGSVCFFKELRCQLLKLKRCHVNIPISRSSWKLGRSSYTRPTFLHGTDQLGLSHSCSLWMGEECLLIATVPTQPTWHPYCQRPLQTFELMILF